MGMQASVLYIAQADNCSRPFAPKAAKSALAAVVARGPCGGFSVVVSSPAWQKLLGTEIGLGLCRCCGSLRKASISGAGADAGRPASHAPRAPVRVDERSNVQLLCRPWTMVSDQLQDVQAARRGAKADAWS